MGIVAIPPTIFQSSSSKSGVNSQAPKVVKICPIAVVIKPNNTNRPLAQAGHISSSKRTNGTRIEPIIIPIHILIISKVDQELINKDMAPNESNPHIPIFTMSERPVLNSENMEKARPSVVPIKVEAPKKA